MLRTRTRSPRPRGRRLLAAVTAAAALAGLAAVVTHARTGTGADRSPAGDRTLTVATWNMCGVREWNCEGTGGEDAKRGRTERLAAESGARVLFLQEACAADVEAVRASLGASWHAEFRAYTWRGRDGRRTEVRCGEPGRGSAGYALLSAYPLSSVRAVPAPQPAVGVQRGILCAFVAAHDITVCTAHLTPRGGDRAHPDREFRAGQLKALVGAVPERRTVYGGDLNVDPPGERNPLSWVWPDQPYGTHRECDGTPGPLRPARPTHVSHHKLDYLFTGLPVLGCRVSDTGVSDHRALLIRVDTGTG